MDWETRIVPFEIAGRRMEMIFTTAALLYVEEKFGGLSELGDKMESEMLKTALWLVEIMANQGVILRTGKTNLPDEEKVTIEWLSYNLMPYRLKEIAELAMQAVRLGMNAETVDVDEDAEVDVVLEEIEKNADGAGV